MSDKILESIDDLICEMRGELDMMKGYFTLTDVQKAEELANRFPRLFWQWLSGRGAEYEDKFWDIVSQHGIDRGDEDRATELFLWELGYEEKSLPDKMMKKFLKFAEPEAARDPMAPSWISMDFIGNVEDEWLIHFTDDPWKLERKGFIYGMDDITMLALTTHFKRTVKERGGYNFAFTTSGADRFNPRGQKYGKHAVVFKTDGVKFHHYGDEEVQVVFWGPAVDPEEIYPVIRKGRHWEVHLPNGDIDEADSFNGVRQIANWAERNL